MSHAKSAACCLLLALCAACSSDSKPITVQTPQSISPPPSSTAAASPTSNLAALPQVAAAEAAYVQMWADNITATQQRNEHLLGHHADGDALAKLRQVYADALAKGYEILGEAITKPMPVSVTPTVAPTEVMLSDCWSEGDYSFVDIASKKQTSVGAKTGYPITSDVRLESGVWKVVSYENKPGAAACVPS